MKTFAPLTQQHLLPSIAFAAGSHAKTFPPLEDREELKKAQEVGYGLNTKESFAHYDPVTSSPKTCQLCLLEGGLESFSQTWPRSGMMRNGKFYRRSPLVPRIYAKGSLSWPTPTASDGKRLRFSIEAHLKSRGFQGNIVVQAIKRLGGYPLPEFAEAMMGLPIGWTASGAAETE